MIIAATDITAEKDLWTVWKTARKIRRNTFNLKCMIWTYVALTLYLVFTRQTSHDIAEMVRAWVNVGIGFASTILGFLVAGFTVFATLSKPSLLAAMARHPEPTSGLSFLKYNFFVFFETFGWYLGFATTCVFVLVFAPAGGAASQLAQLIHGEGGDVAIWIAVRFLAFVVGAWYVLLCLELKSFIFNIYHVVMASIRWTVEYPEKESACHFVSPRTEDVAS